MEYRKNPAVLSENRDLIQQPKRPQRNCDSMDVFDVVFHEMAIGNIFNLFEAFFLPSDLESVFANDKI